MCVQVAISLLQMSEELKRQTTVLAILYAYKIGRDIHLKILSKSNIQPYVYDDGETSSTILQKGYAIQRSIYNKEASDVVQENVEMVDTLPSQIHMDMRMDMTNMSSDNDWRALNVYYATMLEVSSYTILDSSSNPIVRIKDGDLERMTSAMTNLNVSQLIRVYNTLLQNASGLSNSVFRNTMVDISIAMFNRVIDASNKVLRKKQSREVSKMEEAMTYLVDTSFQKARDDFKRMNEEKEQREFDKLVRREDRIEKARQKEQERKEREEERRLKALKKERKIQRREERKREIELKYYNMLIKGEIYGMPDDKKIEKELREEERINKEIKRACGENPFLEFL